MEQKNKKKRGGVIELVLLLLILLLGIGFFSKMANTSEKPKDSSSEEVAVEQIALSSGSIIF